MKAKKDGFLLLCTHPTGGDDTTLPFSYFYELQYHLNLLLPFQQPGSPFIKPTDPRITRAIPVSKLRAIDLMVRLIIHNDPGWVFVGSQSAYLPADHQNYWITNVYVRYVKDLSNVG